MSLLYHLLCSTSRNVLQADKDSGGMRVHRNLKPSVTNIKHLVKILESDTMYRNNAVYNCITGGLETGKIKGLKAQGSTPLEQIITIGYEAHFRVELVLALSSQGYRHAYTSDACRERALRFEKMLAIVKRDRDDNAEKAWRDRSKIIAGLVAEGYPDKKTKNRQPVEPDEDPTMNGMATIPEEYF